MNGITSYSLLQECHSRPPPIPFSLISSNIDHTFFPDANTTLLNLACKTAQSRRRRQGQHSSNQLVQIRGQSTAPFALLSTDQAKVQRVYSEVMMSNDSILETSSKSPSIVSLKVGKTPLFQNRVIRQRPISPEGSIVSSPSAADTKRQQNRRSKILEQATSKSIEVRQLKKPVDLSLVQKPLQATAVHGTDDIDESDEDWAAFIASGYGEFPLPPAHVSPASSIMSGSTFLSPSTCATSLPSSNYQKTDGAWLDDELAWASSDDDDDVVVESKSDEEQEIVKSPMMFQQSENNRLSKLGDLLYTTDSGPQTGYSLSSQFNDKSASVAEMEQKRKLIQSRIGRHGDASQGKEANSSRHGSISSISSSVASIVVSRDSNYAASISTGPSSISTTSTVSLSDSPIHSCSKSVRREPLNLATFSPCRKSQVKARTFEHTRLASLESVVEGTSSVTSPELPFIGDWLLHSSHRSEVPSIEVFDETNYNLQSKQHLQSQNSSKVLHVSGDNRCRPRLRQPSQASSLISSQNDDLERSSLAYLSPNSAIGKGQRTSSNLCHRLAFKMNISRRTSTPDAPVTPCSASSDMAQSRESGSNLSPSCAIFGTAAINARASAYAAMAASMMSSSRDSLRSSASSQKQERSSGSTQQKEVLIPNAGFCFDYDPQSPLYLSSEENNHTQSTSFSSLCSGRSTDQWHKVVHSSVLPKLRKAASFRLYK